jgi:hypothetical protein
VSSLAEQQPQTAPDQSPARRLGTEGVKLMAPASTVTSVDFRKPLRYPADFLTWRLLHLAVPFIRAGMDNQKAWERRFYKQAEALRNH